MNIDIYTIDWVTISALITAIMAIIAGIALHQNSLQLKELKKQWEEKNRARLTFSIVARQDMFLLKITNAGQQTAYDIELNFSNNFIDNHFSEQVKNTYKKIQNTKFAIESGDSKFFFISPIYKEDTSLHDIGKNEHYTGKDINQWLDTNSANLIDITGQY